MLVIISDLHLTDGTSGETIRSGAFRVFRERLNDLAYDASWRADGKYKPIERVDLVLLGDILDLIRSTKWLAAKHPRPWSDPQKPDFAEKFRAITEAILQKNAKSLAILKSFNDGKTITVPPATQDGKLVGVSRDPADKKRQPVAVHIHYLVGNHDWFYHLTGAAFDPIRQLVVEAMGLDNSPNEPFPHDPQESSVLGAVYREHQVFARHGDIFDPFNYEGDRDSSSLGDAIVVELLNRFPSEVRSSMGGELPKACIDGLKEIDNVRPLLIIPVWVDGLLRRTCSDLGQIKKVKDIWDSMADQFLNLDFVRKRDSATDLFDSVDKLEWALKFSRGVSLHTASRLLTWVKEKVGGKESPYYQNAFSERTFKNRTARYIVYGHTHHHEIVPLDSAHLNGKLLNQMYLNSGTWRRVHELAQLNPKDQEFMDYNVMTYLAFFKGDERGGRPFVAWSGALGV